MSWTFGGQPRAPYGLPAVPPPWRLRTGLGGILFVVLIGLALVLAALPVGPLIACYLWLDRFEPEPKVFLVLAFGWGALVATAGALLVQTLNQAITGDGEATSAVLVAPITEEAGKGLFVVLLL